MRRGKKAQFLLVAIILALVCGNVSGETLTVNGTISGTINGDSIQATTAGTLYTEGELPSNVTIVFDSIPSDFHPAALSWSLISIACGNSCQMIGSALNLYSLNGGNYDFNRQISYPDYPGSSLQTVGNVTTTGNALSYTMQVSGNYDGPTDLTQVTNYEATWESGTGDTLDEQGGAVIHREGGGSFQDEWITSYSAGGAALPGYEDVKIIYQTQDFSGTQLDLVWVAQVRISEIPTFTQWGLIILVALLVASAVFVMLRRRKAAMPA